MADNHPCIARDMYGLSKAMMELLISYFANTNPSATFFALRIGAVSSAGWSPTPRRAGSFTSCAYIDLGRVIDEDVIDAILRTLSVAPMPGMHVYNVVGPDNAAEDPVPEVIAKLPGKLSHVNTSFYTKPGNAYASLYDNRKIEREIGFKAKHSVRK
jgi:nucleoside-diphosphate-sugar epimerase